MHLTSGDIVIVSSSAISEIESTTVDSSRPMKKPGMRAGKARTKEIVDEKRRSIATKTPRAKHHTTKKKRKL